MINQYLKNLNKIEFLVTNACTGKCKHCSEGGHDDPICNINPDIAADVVEKVASLCEIKTVMTFGGEPLLCPETVYAVMNVAKKLNVPKRQVITNGFFSTDEKEISNVAKHLAMCGVNDLLLSVDAFHQETIPLDVVKCFAYELKKANVPTKLQPAWLVNRSHDNEYNNKTRQLLDEFRDMEIYENEGNVVFPEGNAAKYLSEYFTLSVPQNPYVEDPKNVKCLSVSADGNVLCGNINEKGILDILKSYNPL